MEKGEYIQISEDRLIEIGINKNKLEQEQLKLSSKIRLEDIDIDSVKTIGGCYITYAGNKVIATIVIMDSKFDIIEEKFFAEKAVFPYISTFLSYRELPTLMKCWGKIEESPDAIMINRSGIMHPRKFGLASHFGLAIDKPVIGITKEVLGGELKEGKVYLNNEVVAEEVITKTGSNPIYISPGNLISMKSAVELSKKWLKLPHKMPEPLDRAKRYADKVKEEFLNA